MPPEWQRRMLREVIGIAKRQAKAIVDHGMEHHSILLVLTGGKRRPSYGVHPLHPSNRVKTLWVIVSFGEAGGELAEAPGSGSGIEG